MADTVHETIVAHDEFITAVVATYRNRLEAIVAKATARTIAEIGRRLALDEDGNILSTPGNARVLKRTATIFQQEMEKAGVGALNRAYAAQFPKQLPFLDEIIDSLAASMKTVLPKVQDALDAEDRNALLAQQSSAVESLSSVVEVVAAGAKRKALFGFAGLSMPDLAETLSQAFAKTTEQSETIADTAQVIFYRTASDRTFQTIEEDLPAMAIRYEYEGPDDKLIRPFCKRLVESGKSYSRDEIGKMNNGQIPVVFLSCGGWNCRHQWMVSLKD